MQETQVQRVGQEDSPREGNGYPFRYSCLGNPTEEPGGLQSMGSRRIGPDLVTKQQQVISHKPQASSSLLKLSRGRAPQVSADCPVKPFLFVLWISPPPQFSLTFHSQALFPMAIQVLSSYFIGKPQHAPLSSSPNALATQSHFV